MEFIDKKDIHLYVFADERMEGWGSRFIQKAGVKGSDEQRMLLDVTVSNGAKLYDEGRLSLVLPKDWLPVFHAVNRNRDLIRPALNWIAEEYLIYKKIASDYLPKDKKQIDWALNHAENFMYVVYCVDESNSKIINKHDVDDYV